MNRATAATMTERETAVPGVDPVPTSRIAVASFIGTAIDDMVANALTILKDDQTLERFKQNAYKEACKFDIQHILPLYEAVYQEAYDSRFKNAIS